MKVLILGATGMLGHTVYNYFKDNTDHEIIGTYRNGSQFPISNQLVFDPLKQSISELPKVDYIINCIGVIKPFIENNIIDSIYVNSTFPHLLAEYCIQNDIKLIHITTDCVFSGRKGHYTEKDVHDCMDTYGKTKSLGEPISKAMVIRTSIIGEEIHKFASLISWAKSKEKQTVNGFINHKWNGISTKKYAQVCSNIINDSTYQVGLFHLYSNEYTKYELLKLINEIFNLKMKILPIEDPHNFVINRTLYSIHKPDTWQGYVSAGLIF